MGKDQGKSEVIVYKGIKFRRYPRSLRWTDRNYYRPNSTHARNGVRMLHQQIWIDAYGPIPESCEIHHKDHNPLNNALDNLECLTKEEHYRHHADNRTLEEIRVKREQVERIRKAAANWHKSDEGRAWHRQLAHLSAEARYKVTSTCERCGKQYESDNIAVSRQRFCSNACKSAWRRESGVDCVTANCATCGNVFTFNRYAPRKFCSRTCAQAVRRVRETRTCPQCGTTFGVWPSKKQRFCTTACAYQAMWHQT